MTDTTNYVRVLLDDGDLDHIKRGGELTLESVGVVLEPNMEVLRAVNYIKVRVHGTKRKAKEKP